MLKINIDLVDIIAFIIIIILVICFIFGKKR